MTATGVFSRASGSFFFSAIYLLGQQLQQVLMQPERYRAT
jgi:hypothetical protein